MPRAGSLSGRVFTHRTALRLATPDERADDCRRRYPMPWTPARCSWCRCGVRTTHGVLSAVRLRGRPVFTTEDLEMATGFANQAAVALELARARPTSSAPPCSTSGSASPPTCTTTSSNACSPAACPCRPLPPRSAPGGATDRVLATVADLDATISQIRTTIFALQQPPQATSRGLRARLLDLVTDLAPALGHEPTVRFSGLLDTLPDRVADDLLAVVREALTNTARHAHATATEVDLTATPDRLTLDIRDDGSGLGDTTRRSGLANLRHRAERHGGALTVDSGPAGTRLVWTVPSG